MTRALLPWNEAERLAAPRSCDVPDTACQAGFDSLARLAVRLTGCATVLVPLSDESPLWFKATGQSPGIGLAREAAFCSHAVADPPHPLIVPDATADVRFARDPLVTGPPGIRFYAGIPLIDHQGQAAGVLCLIDFVPRELPPADIDTILELAQAVMSAIELRRMLAQADRQAQLADERFSLMIEAVPTAVVLSGKDQQIRLINRYTERLFGYGRAELQGKPVELLLPERLRPPHDSSPQTFLAHMSSRVIGSGQALFGLRKDGSEFAAEIELSPLPLGGEPMVLTVFVDLGPRQAIELKQEEQRSELQRSNADLREFAYVASHDLKAPLRAVAHLAEWIRADISLTANPDTLASFTLLQARVARLQSLLDGLLAYARAERDAIAPEYIDIEGLVQEVTGLLELPAGFEVVCEQPMWVIRAPRTPIQMVFSNLIGNAVKHHDQATGRVTVSMRVLDDLAEFRVSDDGPGIAKRFHGRIFEIFQTLKSRDDTESSGIGLSIVKKQVQRYGGQITVESDPPVRGTRFIFTWRIIPFAQKVCLS